MLELIQNYDLPAGGGAAMWFKKMGSGSEGADYHSLHHHHLRETRAYYKINAIK